MEDMRKTAIYILHATDIGLNTWIASSDELVRNEFSSFQRLQLTDGHYMNDNGHYRVQRDLATALAESWVKLLTHTQNTELPDPTIPSLEDEKEGLASG